MPNPPSICLLKLRCWLLSPVPLPLPRLCAPCHPWLWSLACLQALLDWCTQQGVHVTAYSPLGSPDSAAQFKRSEDVPRVLEDKTVNSIATKLDKSAGQVRHVCAVRICCA